MPGIFTRNQLKIIAVLTMLCDHVAVVLVWRGEFFTPLRIIGRIAFPIFAYFVVQGFLYTSDYGKYLLRIGIFALVSEIPFDLAFNGQILEFQSQNVMFTLFIGLVMLYFLREWEDNSAGLKYVVLVIGGICGWFLRVDYSWFGVLLIGFFYLLRLQSKMYQFLLYALLFYSYGGIQVYGLIGIVCIFLHSNEKEDFALPKYFFYLFYPVHLLVLWGIERVVLGG